MGIKAVLKTLDGLPDALKSLYTEKDGMFYLDAEGVDDLPSVGALKRAHERQKELNQSQKDALSKFEGVDLEELKTLAAEAKKNRDKKMIDEGKVDELVAQRIGEAQKNFEKQLGLITADRDGMGKQLEVLLVDSQVNAEAAQRGIRKTALTDVLLRARTTFKVKDGAAVALDGDKVIYGKDPNTPLTIGEWMGKLNEEAPHLFESSSGGGAGGGSGGGGGIRVIDRNDSAAFGANLEAIAKGEITVR